MQYPSFSRLGVVLVVVLLTVSAAPATAVQSPTQTDSVSGPSIQADTSYANVTEEVQVWNRAPLPLRTGTETAATVIESPNLFVNLREADSGDVPANKQEFAIYGSDSSIPIRFQSATGAGTETFAGENVQLLVAKSTTMESASVSSMWTDPTEVVGDPMDLLNESADVEGVEYELLDAPTISEEGTVSLNYDLSTADRGAGEYTFFLVSNGTDGDGFTVDSNGDLDVTGNATVLGFDNAVAHQRSSNITHDTNTIEPGDNVSFTVPATDSETELNHTIVLYNNSTVADSRMLIDLYGSVEDGVSDEDIAVEYSIDRVNGVVRVVAPNRSEMNVTRTGNLTAFDFIGVNTSNSSMTFSDADTDRMVVLNASMTAQMGGSTPVSVVTLDNWSTGEYRWVHMAVASNGSLISSDTGGLNIAASTDDEDDDDDGGDDGDGDDGGDDGDPPTGDGGDGDTGSSADISAPSSTSVEVRITQSGPDESVDLEFGDQSPQQSGVTLSGLSAQMGSAGGNVSISASLVESVPADIPQPPTPPAAIISVETDSPESAITSGQFRFSVSDERLESLGIAPDNVTLYRYHNETWNAFETQHLGGNQFTADTPGFSYFAVGATSPSDTDQDVTAEPGDDQDGEEDVSSPVTEAATSPDGDDEDRGSGIPFLPIGIIAIAAIAAGVIYYRQQSES